MAETERRFGAFERIGIELEYMIVDRNDCAVLPIADRLLVDEHGGPVSDVEHGEIAWSNELVQHVLEFKTNGPAPDLVGWTDRFQSSVRLANERLAAFDAALMPGGMHPTMDPHRETVLWPHDYGPVYETFDRIFECSGHGWSNLQSVHVNLPFRDDAEFGRLHAAIRCVLPIVPALAASSPIIEGRVQPWLDTRLEVYSRNARRVPFVSGLVVPEPVASEAEYRDLILARIYRDLEPLDPEGILRHEWVNARGAIARFDRGTIEIRVIDAQECPAADLAVAATINVAVRALFEGATSTAAEQNGIATEALAAILADTIRDADEAVIRDERYLALLAWDGPVPCTARSLWSTLADRYARDAADAARWGPALDNILANGCLGRRMLRHTGTSPEADTLLAIQRRLMRCLETGAWLQPEAGTEGRGGSFRVARSGP
ncbi:MAG: glutamate-cysteine ligase family protein [Gemmatimonadota bacterium]